MNFFPTNKVKKKQICRQVRQINTFTHTRKIQTGRQTDSQPLRKYTGVVVSHELIGFLGD